jgi:hypothetical protein
MLTSEGRATATASEPELRRALAELNLAVARHEQLGWTRSDPPVRELLRRIKMTRNSLRHLPDVTFVGGSRGASRQSPTV